MSKSRSSSIGTTSSCVDVIPIDRAARLATGPLPSVIPDDGLRATVTRPSERVMYYTFG